MRCAVCVQQGLIDAPLARLIAVMYHYVHEPRSLGGINLQGHTPTQLKQDIRILKQRFNAATPTDIINFFTEPQSIEGDYFVLTFDDGLKDHVRHCGPILAESDIIGHFLVPGLILRESGILTVHKRHLLAGAMGEQAFEEKLLHLLSITKEKFDLDAMAPVQTACKFFRFGSNQVRQLKYYLSYILDVQTYNTIIGEIFRQEIGEEEALFSEFYLSRDDCRTLEALGMEVGGHGYHHDHLARMPDDAQEQDIERVSRALSEILPRRPRTFSYPYGRPQRSFNALSKTLVEKAGFYCAFSNAMGENETAKDLYAIERIDANYVRGRYGG
jgi:peptidoglycan/xylan/chitin deacetylase (PgdA/CDA1 family)